MGNIVLLDELTINKIAAGEVIERPSSVIKEMVENSIDAGANNITIEIKNGGISYIKITDNGKGIAADDLEIAFERHATSKIRSAEDLSLVTSMGFRGEALASIAAIANVEMISKTESQDTGYKVVVEAGDVLEKQEIGCQTGTSITVRNLFFNTPVRYKFLKKDYTESGYVEDVVTRIALVNPNIAIKLINTGKTVIQTNGNGDLKSVIYSIYGKDVANGILPMDYIYEDVKISGVIGKPEIARSNRTNQLFFVNKRYIKDKTISAAVEQAFKGLIPLGKFGFAILNIQINPSKVDVNVHPAKLEVRFEEENKIFQAIYHSIKDTLLKSELIEDTGKQEVEEQEATKQENSINKSVGLFDFRQEQNDKIEKYTEQESKIKTNVGQGGPVNTADVLEELRKMQQDIKQQVEENPSIKLNQDYIEMQNKENSNSEFTDKEQSVENIIESEQLEEKEDNKQNESKETESVHYDENQKDDFDKMYAKLFGEKPISDDNQKDKNDNIQNIDSALEKDNISIFEQSKEYKLPTYKFVGIAFNTYIIIEIGKEMYIIDQHAAHERIMYEKVKENYYSESTKNSQMLLLPDIITLTHKEMEIAKENMDMFKNAGFSLEEFGDNTIKLTGVPTVCVDLDNKELFLETLDEINTVARTAKQEKEEKFISTVACKAAVKANMVLTKEEVDSLMDKLLQLPNPFTCPHGRPTAIKMTKYGIERKFARK